MYYEAVNNAIKAGTEYVSISQPDSTLAVTCVTSILAAFLTYCLYQFGLKNSLNQNNLHVDEVSGIVSHIATGNTTEMIEDIVVMDSKKKTEKKKTEKKTCTDIKNVEEDTFDEHAAG